MLKTIFNILLILSLCFTLSMIPLDKAFLNSPAESGEDPTVVSEASEYEVIVDSDNASGSNPAQVEFTIKGIFNKDFSDDFVLFDFIRNGETIKTMKASDFSLDRDSSSDEGISNLNYSVNIDRAVAGLEGGAYSVRIYVEDETAIAMDEAYAELFYVPSDTFKPAATFSSTIGQMNLRLYYPDNQYMYLVPVTRTVPEQSGLVRYLINTLSEGPAASIGLPEGSPIPSIPYIWVSGKTATISLPAGDLGVYDDGSTASLIAADSITNTLRDNLGIDEVVVLVNRQAATTALHGMDVSEPWQTKGGPRAFICLKTKTGRLVLAPAKLEADSYDDAIEQMFAAFKTGVVNGVDSPNSIAFMPSNVTVKDYKISGGVITMDLSADITKIYGERTDIAHLAVESLLNSLTTLMNVDKVVLTANGEPIQFETYDFTEPVDKPAFINPEM